MPLIVEFWQWKVYTYTMAFGFDLYPTIRANAVNVCDPGSRETVSRPAEFFA